MDADVPLLKKYIHPALAEYLSSVTFQATGLLGTVCWIVSSVFGSTMLQAIAASVYVVPAISYYLYYRPFGIEVSYTPTVEKNGERTADKVAEKRGEAHLRNGKCVITLLIDISDYRENFELEFRTSNEVHTEFRDIPRDEHNFSYDPLTLSGSDITTRRFQLVLEVFLEGDTSTPTDEYPLEIVDIESGRNILVITLVSR